MKTTIFTSVLLVIALMSSNAKTKNETNSATVFGTYQVSQTENPQAVVNGSEGAYTIHYSEFDNPVHVTVILQENCKVFLVRTNGFEVQYACNGKYFGVQYMSEANATYPVEEMKQKVDRVDYLHQRLITRKSQSEKEMVRLIACFLPELMS